MSWRAKTERMSYRHGNHHKRPGKVLSQEGLTKQNVSNKLWTKGNACRTWLKLAEYVAGKYKKMQFSKGW